MKELSIEQKAQRFDEAIEKARQLCAYPTTKPFISDLQDIFPELAESEDEKIRGAIIDHLKDNNLTEWAAWLEKQGEQKSTIEMKTPEESGEKESPTFEEICALIPKEKLILIEL